MKTLPPRHQGEKERSEEERKRRREEKSTGGPEAPANKRAETSGLTTAEIAKL